MDRIADIMYAEIHKTLFRHTRGRRRRGASIERVLEGTAVSPDDVLSEAVGGLLRHWPERLEGTWEGLAVTIAHNKAVDALRASRKGLRETEQRPELRLVSGDAERQGSGGETQPPLFEVLPSTLNDPESEYLRLESALALRDLARDVLDERTREIFFAIHFDGDSRTEVGARVDLTSQRVGQIYRAALYTLAADRRFPFRPVEPQQGRHR
jgi:RNA polymerase sigma factor (sigma-70 family)